MTKGVPFDIAFSLDEDYKMAMVVLTGTWEGNEFDWNSQTWKERS